MYFFDPDDLSKQPVSYSNQYILDPEQTVVVDGDSIIDGTLSFSPESAGEYEVIALYSVRSGETGLNSIINNYKHLPYVADHLDADSIKAFVDGWIGGSELKGILEEYDEDVRAAFNDSYEFKTDIFYNSKIYEMAKSSQSVIGYDIVKYLPALYKQGEEAFTIFQPVNKEIGFAFSATNAPFLSMDMEPEEWERIEYDYHRLINEAFLGGMEAFSDALSAYGLVYRQQAYNPPIDTLKSSKFVDIPETEGLVEYSLKRVSSGAHLYDRNLVTAEVFTLGSTPFTVTPEDFINGFDTLAYSGVNNFFYHGLNAVYFGTAEQKQSGLYGEEGWRGWPTIGVELGKSSKLSAVFEPMNMYAARLNYAMQAGKQYSDVAYYMPLFGSLGLNTVVKTFNEEGLVWDAINDDTIQNRLTVKGGRLHVSASDISFDALVVDTNSLPVETVNQLLTLAGQGADILFYGTLPDRQPGFADGNYHAGDKKVSDTVQSILGYDNAVFIKGEKLEGQGSFFAGPAEDSVSGSDDLRAALQETCDAVVALKTNINVKMNKRILDSGGMLVFVKNISTVSNSIRLKFSDDFNHFYLLDQSNGNIYNANKEHQDLDLELEGNASIIVLAQPEGYELDSSRLRWGTPAALVPENITEKMAVSGFSLNVAADNIGSYLPHDSTVFTAESHVLGDWSAEENRPYGLAYVSDPGVYRASFILESLDLEASSYSLDLGTVYHAAEIFINGTPAGVLYKAPFRLDISEYLKAGENSISITVHSTSNNRWVGLRKGFDEDGIEKYRYYNIHVRGLFSGPKPLPLQPKGLIGDVTVSVIRQ